MVGGLTWNSNGTLRQLQITDGFNAGGAQTCSYGYDDLTRVTSNNCGSLWSQTFSYDAFGNITKSGNSAWQPGYNSATNRYQNGSTYDSDGQLLTDTFHTYTWNIFNRPATIDTTTLTYDAFDYMVETNVSGGATTEVQYSPVGKVCTMNGHTTQVHCNIPLPGGAIFSPSPDTLWHSDWQGSVRLGSTNGSRTVSMDRAYAPFGELYNTVIGGTSNPDYTGLTSESTSDELDTPARQLHPGQSRWISPDPSGLAAVDPLNPQTWNRYAFVLNNPLSNVDPSGLECVWDDGSYDAADDPKTGSFEGCSGQGGTWVDPGYFENAILTNGQLANINPGDWSADPNSTIASSWLGASGTAYGGEWAAGQEVDEALDEFYGNGPKPTIVYGPDDPFTLSFLNSMGMQGILAGIKANCSATTGRVPVGTFEAFVNTMIDGPYLQSGGEGGWNDTQTGYYTPEAQMGGFSSTYTRSGGVVDITVTNPITLNSLALHGTAPLGIRNSTSGHFGTVNQELHMTAPDPCQ